MCLKDKLTNKLLVILIIIFSQLILYTNAFAITWQEVVSIAKKNSNSLKSAQLQLDSSVWTKVQAYSNFMPQVSSSLSLRTATNNTLTHSYGVNVTQYIFKGLENYYNLKSAQTDYLYYKANLVKTSSDVLYDLRIAFIDLFTTQENIKLLKTILSRRRENTRLIQLRYEIGREDRGNLLLTKATEEEAKYNLNSENRSLKLLRLKITQLLGHNVLTVNEIIKIKNISSPSYNILIENSPSYIMQKYQLKSAEIDKKVSISRFLPSVSLAGNWQNTSTRGFDWSLNLSYSLFTGGSRIANRKTTSLNYDRALEDFQKTKKELLYTIEEAYEKYNDSLELYNTKKIYLSAVTERAIIAKAKYLNGLTSYDEWTRTEDSYISALKSLLSYQSTVLNAEALWYKTIGSWVK